MTRPAYPTSHPTPSTPAARGRMISRIAVEIFQMEQQIRRARLSDGHGEGHRGEPREGRGAGKEDVPLSAEWFGKLIELVRGGRETLLKSIR